MFFPITQLLLFGQIKDNIHANPPHQDESTQPKREVDRAPTKHQLARSVVQRTFSLPQSL